MTTRAGAFPTSNPAGRMQSPYPTLKREEMDPFIESEKSYSADMGRSATDMATRSRALKHAIDHKSASITYLSRSAADIPSANAPPGALLENVEKEDCFCLLSSFSTGDRREGKVDVVTFCSSSTGLFSTYSGRCPARRLDDQNLHRARRC